MRKRIKVFYFFFDVKNQFNKKKYRTEAKENYETIKENQKSSKKISQVNQMKQNKEITKGATGLLKICFDDKSLTLPLIFHIS